MGCLIKEDYNLDDNCDVTSAGVLELRVMGHRRSEETFSESIALGEVGIINGVLTGSDAATPANWKIIHQDMEISEATQDIEGNRENAAVAYPVSVTLTMHYTEDIIRNEKINRLAEELVRKNSVISVKLQNGTERLYGRQNGLRGLEGSDSTGKAMTDLNGVTITLKGKEPRRWNSIRQNEGTPANIAVGYQAVTLS